jgi:two-component sensor histidine kinase
MVRWSLRTKLVAIAVLALLPVLMLSGWRAYHDSRIAQGQRAEAASSIVDLAVSRQRELVEGSRRLLVAACADDAVRAALEATATAADVERCEGYLAQLLQRFPADYSALVVIDGKGTARCSSTPAARGMSFADREVFKTAQQSHGFTVGSYIASRVTPRTVVPVGVPVLQDGKFHGVCTLGLSLRSMAEQLAAPQSAGATGVALVDREGTPLGGDPRAVAALPVPSRVAGAIAASETTFSDYAQNGATYDFSIRPLVGTLFVVGAVAVDRSFSSLMADWWEFALIAVAGAALLCALWVGTDRWCVQPLRYLQDFAGRVARGDTGALEPPLSWGPEMRSVGARVNEMAAAIASREKELKAGLEQRDHMLREIHHRVKNNLQMISSLLNLQAGEIRSPRIRRFFGDAQNRVLTLSILHRHLYERSSWSLVDFQQFISDLVRQISVARPGIERPQPRYTIRAPIMAVGPDIAIPVGLIVTEAVGRALNHDFASVAVPEIRIEAHEKGEEVELVIEDNGLDPPRGPAAGATRGSFGLTLIRGLAMQLGGEVEMTERAGGGTRVVVTFPMPRDDPEAATDA